AAHQTAKAPLFCVMPKFPAHMEVLHLFMVIGRRRRWLLPKKNRRGVVSGHINLLRHSKWISGNPPVVIAHPANRNDKADGDRPSDTCHHRVERSLFLNEKSDNQNRKKNKNKYATFIRP